MVQHGYLNKKFMRIIARLDIKNNFVIKGINLEGLRKIGDPISIANNYYEQKIDEIIYIDSVASLYKRNSLPDTIEKTSENVFVPMTVGGGIRSLGDIELLLKSGADKVAINSFGTEEPNFINEAVKNFGSSTIVIYVEAKKISEKKWEVYKYSGREKTGLDLIYWIDKIQEFECGEILLTSVDYEGMKKGFDIEMVNQIYDKIKVPLILSGGCGNIEHIKYVKKNFNNVSVALASLLHYKIANIKEIKREIE